MIKFFKILFALKSVIIGDMTLTLDSVDKIWATDAHEAFTSIDYYNGEYYVAFRSGTSHKSYDGNIEIIKSKNLKDWQTDQIISYSDNDLRDPSFFNFGKDELYLNVVSRNKRKDLKRHNSFLWDKTANSRWNGPNNTENVRNSWKWGIFKYDDIAYSIGYLGEDKTGTLYTATNSTNWKIRKRNFFPNNKLNFTEAALFKTDHQFVTLARANGANAFIGVSNDIEGNWKWKDLGIEIGSPNGIVLDKDYILLAVRLYNNRIRTSICVIDLRDNSFKELFELPSGGDTGYADIYKINRKIYITYHSSFSKNSDIYLAKLTLFN